MHACMCHAVASSRVMNHSNGGISNAYRLLRRVYPSYPSGWPKGQLHLYYPPPDGPLDSSLGETSHKMSSFEEMLAALLRNPPDPNEPLPRTNRKETIYGVAISFMVRRVRTSLGIEADVAHRYYHGWQFCFVFGFALEWFESQAGTICLSS